jgi:hypothetical protein
MRMDTSHTIVLLPPAEQFICQLARLVKIQALAGAGVRSLYSQTVDSGIFRGEYDIPNFGQFSIVTSIYNSDYAIIDGLVVDGSQKESSSSEPKIFTLSRLSKEAPWISIWVGKDIDQSDIERLTSFVYESPQEAFERLFDVWFYDYPGIVPDDFTLERIESIYSQTNPDVIFQNI